MTYQKRLLSAVLRTLFIEGWSLVVLPHSSAHRHKSEADRSVGVTYIKHEHRLTESDSRLPAMAASSVTSVSYTVGITSTGLRSRRASESIHNADMSILPSTIR